MNNRVTRALAITMLFLLVLTPTLSAQVPTESLSTDPYWGVFVQCKTLKNGEYRVVMGYLWEGSEDLPLDRSDLNKTGISGRLPQTFKPGRHTFTLKTSHDQFVWTVRALGRTKTTTFGAPNVSECPYWGIFVDCVLPDDNGYKVRFGYKWDGDQPLILERSDLNRQSAVTGTVPQVFEPGRHTFDIYVNDLNNIVWTVNAQGKGKTTTGSPNYQTICQAPTPEPTPVTAKYNTAIGDRVWLDDNGDGIQDAGEANMPDVTVTLLDDEGSELGQRVTGPTGFYIFTGLMAGRYQLRFDLPEGYAFSLENRGGDEYIDSDVDEEGLTDLFTVGDDTIDYRWDAGLVPDSGQFPPEGRTVLALPLVILGD